MNKCKLVLLNIMCLLLCSPILVYSAKQDIYISFFNETIAQILPDYRLPVESDYDAKGYWGAPKDSYIWKTADNEGLYKAPYWTKGVFNDDSLIDYAFILINLSNGNKSLFAFLSSGNSYKYYQLVDNFNEEMGLATQDKSATEKVVSKGHEPLEEFINKDAIAFFSFEGASSVFIWNSTQEEFNGYWITE